MFGGTLDSIQITSYSCYVGNRTTCLEMTARLCCRNQCCQPCFFLCFYECPLFSAAQRGLGRRMAALCIYRTIISKVNIPPKIIIQGQLLGHPNQGVCYVHASKPKRCPCASLWACIQTKALPLCIVIGMHPNQSVAWCITTPLQATRINSY